MIGFSGRKTEIIYNDLNGEIALAKQAERHAREKLEQKIFANERLKLDNAYYEKVNNIVQNDIEAKTLKNKELEVKQKDDVLKLKSECARMQQLHKHMEELEKRNWVDPNYPKTTWQQTEMFDKYLNIGMIGVGRVGKSCFVNTIRGIKNQKGVAKEIWAPTDSGVECTLTATPYLLNTADIDLRFGDFKLNIWDLPGYGTVKNPNNTFIKNQGVKYFDLVLVFTGEVFSAQDEEIIGELREHKVPFILVRNKMDQKWQDILKTENLWLNSREQKSMKITDDDKRYDKTNQRICDLYKKMTEKTYDSPKNSYYEKCLNNYTNFHNSLIENAKKKLDTRELFCISSNFDNYKLYDYEKFISEMEIKIKEAIARKEEMLKELRRLKDESEKFMNDL